MSLSVSVRTKLPGGVMSNPVHNGFPSLLYVGCKSVCVRNVISRDRTALDCMSVSGCSVAMREGDLFGLIMHFGVWTRCSRPALL